MPLLFPTQGTLSDAFSSKLPFGQAESSPQSNRRSAEASPANYSIWSVSEDRWNKAGTLSEEAAAELRRSSQAIQARTGQIELHSAQYYATCTLGGLIACVGFLAEHPDQVITHGSPGDDSHGGDAAGLGQMPTTGRPEDVPREL